MQEATTQLLLLVVETAPGLDRLDVVVADSVPNQDDLLELVLGLVAARQEDIVALLGDADPEPAVKLGGGAIQTMYATGSASSVVELL